jgi:recombination endonuclease VII
MSVKDETKKAQYAITANARRRKRYDEDPQYRESRLASGRDFRMKTKEKLEADPEAKKKARDRARAHQWRKTYKIVDMTLEEFDRRLIRQGGVCKLCRIPKPDETLCVDHDHATGRTRGLLCRKCNSGLGHLDDSLGRVLRAAWYLSASIVRDGIARAAAPLLSCWRWLVAAAARLLGRGSRPPPTATAIRALEPGQQSDVDDARMIAGRTVSRGDGAAGDRFG